jgi:outer membrane protein assembly factor BamA
MKFNFLRTYFTLYKKITGDFYAGAAYCLDYHYKIQDLKLDTTSSSPVLTSHYVYSRYYGYPLNAYTSSGIGLNALYDSRDHTMNPYHGTFAQASVRFYPTWLGSTAGYTSFYAEARKYVPLSEARPRHLLAFWMVSQFTVGGKPPYLDLPASGYDMYNSSARGYIQGRWRGTEWMSLESEWRLPITNSGLLGAVVFANATTTSRPEVNAQEFGITKPALPIFGAIRYAVGGGLRIMLMRASRMNLSIDYARGENGSSGVYIYAGEAF